MTKVEALSSADCIHALKLRFAPPEWALLEQVANGTGSAIRRYADAVAFNLWPSRGLSIVGFEVKVRKSDWKKELADPRKSAEVQRFCDHWWIVAPAGLIPTTDLPATWGLLEVKGGKVRVKKEAPELKAEPVTRKFMAAAMRRYHDGHASLLKSEYQRGRRDGAENGSGDLSARLRILQQQVQGLEQVILDFQKESGVDIRHYRGPADIGAAVRLVLDANRRNSLKEHIQRELYGLDSVRKQIEKQLKALESIK